MRKRKARRHAGAPQAATAASPAAAPASPDAARLSPALAAAILVAAALALYWSSLRNPLVFDDYHLREPALRTHFADAALRLAPRWISDATFGWVYALFGKEVFWQRLLNVMLHAAAATALYAFVSRLTGALLQDARARWLALAGALLFVLHPAAVYGAGYLMQRSIVLATLFSVITLACVLEALLREGRGRRAWGWYAAAAAAYFLAVSSKEHAVMVPAVAVALAVLVRGASWRLARNLALGLAPFAVIGLYVVFRTRGVLVSAYEPFAADALGGLAARGGFDASLAYPLSVLSQATLFFRYLGTWLAPWPGWMSIDLRPAFPARLLEPGYVAGFAGWLAFAAGGAWLVTKPGRFGLLGFAMLFAWLLSLTEFSTVRIQELFVLYRSYLWMSVPVVLLPALAGRLPPKALAVAIALAFIALIPAARGRLDSFSSPLKVWDDAVRKNTDLAAPNVERAIVARGIVHVDAGRFPEAGRDFDQALAVNARLPDAYLGRATLYLRTGQLLDARADLDRALALDPAYGEAYHKRCVVRVSLRQTADAIADCEKAQQLDGANHEVWVNSGVVYRALNRRDEAEKAYRRALQLAPRDPSAHYNYGVLLLDTGRRDEEVRRHIQLGCNGGIPSACELLAPKPR